MTAEQTLIDFAKAVGSQDIEITETGDVDFYVERFRAIAYVKEGGSRIRGSVFLAEVDRPDEARDWVARQPQPHSGVLECVEVGEGEQGHLLRILFERPVAGPNAEGQWLLTDALDYGEAWHDRTDLGDLIDPAQVPAPGDPRDLVPANAWLLMGTEKAFPSATELRDDAERGHAGVFEYLWTAAKQTEEGDLALVYFLAPRKAVHFIARAASRSFFDRNIKVVADGKVADEQWWAYFTTPIEVEPIPLDVLQVHANGHLPLKGRSGRYLRPETIAGLPLRPKHPEDQRAFDRVLVTPVGRADLPAPEDVTMDVWRHLAAGAMPLEETVSQYVVEPLLRYALDGTDLTYPHEHRVGRKSADYVVLDGERPRCVVEVKLAIRESPDGVWANSKDFRQLRGYADALGCSGVLIDANRVLLVARGEEKPFRIVERRHATDDDLAAIRRHVTG